MKSISGSRFLLASYFSLLTAHLLFAPTGALAQGNLAPPGAPAPTFKTLEQIEPRKEINATNTPGDGDSVFRINVPGSYYLTGNITGAAGKMGIEIASSNVIVDLNGFTLQGVSGSLDGIRQSVTAHNITIRNGAITGFVEDGIDLSALGDGVLIEQIHVSANSFDGINAGSSAVLRACTASNNGGNGISASASAVTGCSASSNGAHGISAGTSTVTDCAAFGNGSDGIFASSSTTVTGCAAFRNFVDGIGATSNCHIVGNVCNENGFGGDGAGIHVSGNSNRIEGNTVANADRGIDADIGPNTIRDNLVRNNTDNYAIAGGNLVEILLCQLPETIEISAKVILAGTLTGSSGQNGITVASDNVTIDLNGHALVGVAGSLDGIVVSGTRTNLSVRNGIVRGWGGDGIDTSTATIVEISDVKTTNNVSAGLRALAPATASKVWALSNAGGGIRLTGVGGIIEHCRATNNTGGGGIFVDTAAVHDSEANNNEGGPGIRCGGASTILRNTANQNGTAASTLQDGFFIEGGRSRVEGNHAFNNSQDGYEVTNISSTNAVLFIGNSAGSNDVNEFNIGINNAAGPIVSPAGVATTTSPTANFDL